MGGMVAQAPAVLHPGQVSRLILAATQDGTGTSLPIPPAVQAILAGSDPAAGWGNRVRYSGVWPPERSPAVPVMALKWWRASSMVANTDSRAFRPVIRSTFATSGCGATSP